MQFCLWRIYWGWDVPSRPGRPGPREKDQRKWACLKVNMPREIYSEVMETVEMAKRLGIDACNTTEALRMICAEFRATWGVIHEEMSTPQTAYQEVVRTAYERDGWKCLLCGAYSNLTPHHITPRSHLGEDRLENLATLCMRCHNGVTDRTGVGWREIKEELLEKIGVECEIYSNRPSG